MTGFSDVTEVIIGGTCLAAIACAVSFILGVLWGDSRGYQRGWDTAEECFYDEQPGQQETSHHENI